MILPVYNPRFCTAIHFSHDGIVLNLSRTGGAIATGGGKPTPECAKARPEGGRGMHAARENLNNRYISF
jgi:hypothetical protein